MHRYLAFVWNSQLSDADRKVAQSTAPLLASEAWVSAHEGPGSRVLQFKPKAGSAATYKLAEERGVILGNLFRRHDIGRAPDPITFGPSESRRIVQTHGRHLVENYWGRYVAIVRDPYTHSYHILRDPTAMLQCWRLKWDCVDVFFSHAEDIVRCVPVNISLNWKFLAMHLLGGGRFTREAGLCNIEDLPGGETLTLCASGRERRTIVWSPSDFCSSDVLEDEAIAAKQVRSAVQGCIDAWASKYEKVLHLLSGGLDSSIVAGCLAQAPKRPEVACLNMFTGNNTGHAPIVIPAVSKQTLAKYRRVSAHADERRFAQLVAQSWSFPVREHQRRTSDIDLRRAWQSPLCVDPTMFVGYSDMDEVELRTARECGSQAVFSGLGGDTVFYATSQPLGAIDYFYSHPLGRRSMRYLWSASTLSKESFWSVLASSTRNGLLRRTWSPPYDVLKRPNLLTEHSVFLVTEAEFEHPWVRQATRLPPGKRYHVSGLAMSALFYTWGFGREREVESVNPLVSQPIVETCLRIPTYVLAADGISRGLARRAFSDLLPVEIKKRTAKGDGGPFYQELVRANIGFIREALLDGVLSAEGILDRKRLDEYLINGQPFKSVMASQIIDYLTVEAWAQQWTSYAENSSVRQHLQEPPRAVRTALNT